MKHKFDLIENIDLDDESSWVNKIFLTLDVDWAHDEVWNEAIELLESFDIPATWFITHNSSLISRILKNPKFRIGIHPNFNKIINIEDNSKSVDKIIKEFNAFCPKSRLLRSHCLLQSELLLDIFLENDYDYVFNTFIPLRKKQKIAPWTLWNYLPSNNKNGQTPFFHKHHLKSIPHCWQDNVSLKMHLTLPSETFLNQLIVMNFHPIHIYLNTESISRYEDSRRFHQNPLMLKKFKNNKMGIKTILLKYLEDSH